MIYCENCTTVTITNASFSNSGTKSGGALMFDFTDTISGSIPISYTISSSNFTSTYCSEYGGAIFINGIPSI